MAQPRRSPDGPRNKTLRGLDRFQERFPLRKFCRDHSRIGAAGPVGMPGLDALGPEDLHASFLKKKVRGILLQMPAFDQHRPGPHLHDHLCRLLHGFQVMDADTGQR